MFEGQSGEDGLFQVPKTCRFDMKANARGKLYEESIIIVSIDAGASF